MAQQTAAPEGLTGPSASDALNALFSPDTLEFEDLGSIQVSRTRRVKGKYSDLFAKVAQIPIGKCIRLRPPEKTTAKQFKSRLYLALRNRKLVPPEGGRFTMLLVDGEEVAIGVRPIKDGASAVAKS